MVNIDKIHSKFVYNTPSSKVSVTLSDVKKYDEMFNLESLQLDWERIFSIPFSIALDTKLRKLFSNLV